MLAGTRASCNRDRLIASCNNERLMLMMLAEFRVMLAGSRLLPATSRS